MKALIYARIATRTQEQYENCIQAQIVACSKYAKGNGYEVTGVFVDAGYSGMSLERPGLDKMRELIARGLIHVVVVSDIARLTRSAIDKLYLERAFADRGVELHCVANNVGSVTAQSFPGRRMPSKKSLVKKS